MPGNAPNNVPNNVPGNVPDNARKTSRARSRVRRVASIGTVVVRVLVVTIAFTALLLLVLLAAASANTEFFDRYYSWLYTANIGVTLIFMFVITALIVVIAARWRRGKFGTRLLAKLAFFFALVGVVPGGIIYVVSYQFASRSIESWFDVNVDTALTAGLNLGRGMLDASLSDLQTRGKMMAEQVASADSSGTTLTLLRLRDQFGVQDATIVEAGRGVSGTAPDVRVVAQASGDYASLLPGDLPTPAMIEQARTRNGYAAIEGEVDGNPHAHGAKGALRLRVVRRIPDDPGTSLLRPAERFLQLTQLVSPSLAHNADAVQRAYREYQEKSLGRTGLRKMYIGTLTLALFLAAFVAIMLAIMLGNQLTRPLFLLAQGTREVTAGDYTPKREVKSRDELGFLTQSFNAMTRQLSEARLAVETNRVALEHSKAYLESILANLTAGVFVFDRQFRLMTANPGAERIFRQSFQAHLGEPLDAIAVLSDFGAMVRRSFADRGAVSSSDDESDNDLGHWQQQCAVPVAGETDPATLLVRGARLVPGGERDDACDAQRDVRHDMPHDAPHDAQGSDPGAPSSAESNARRHDMPHNAPHDAQGSDPGAPSSVTSATSAESNAIQRAPKRIEARAETPAQTAARRVSDDASDAQGARYVVVFDDISDVISAQRSIAWGEVARRLAHEIKNPLTPIQLSAERLQMKLSGKLASDDADVLKRGATTIVNQVAAMKQMVDNFRDYAHTPPAVLANLQLNDLVSEVLTLYGVEDGKSPIHAKLAALPVIRGDATQLRQVIHNLLRNAQDAVAQASEPRVLIETRVVEYGNPDAQGHTRVAVRLAVSDNGPGFPARILTRAFEPYVTTKARGTGLGLAMVKKIVDEHGARIDVRNRTKAGGMIEGAQISILFLQLADESAQIMAKTTVHTGAA